MGSIHDLDLPISPILALPISCNEASTSQGERLVKGRLEIGQREPLGVFLQDTHVRSDIEVVEGGVSARRRRRSLGS